MNWMEEAAIQSDVVTSSSPTRNARETPREMNMIALTGSTGFLGQELLRQLDESPDVQVIHCLAVRSEGSGIARKSSLRESDKIIYHFGDLCLLSLGMETATLSSIMQECNRIVYCAADISFVKSYELLKAINVGSTKTLAQLAIEFSDPFHFVSSAALSHWTDLDSVGETSMREYPPALDGDQGYLTSKWVSEIYLENCNMDYGLPVTIHRISSIVGPGAPDLDITNNILQYACRLRAVPNLRSCEGFVDLISLQTAAANIMADALTTPRQAAPVRYVNESGEIQVAASQLKEYLERELGTSNESQPFQELERDEWTQLAQESGMSNLVASFLRSLPPLEIDIAMPFLRTSRIYERGTFVSIKSMFLS